MPLPRRAIAATAVAAVALPAVAHATGTHQHHRLKVTGKATTLALSDAAQGALTAAGVTVSPLGKATASDAGITFPVARGRVNAKLTRGIVVHRGGIALAKADGKTVRLHRPVAVVGKHRAFLAVRLGGLRVIRAFRLTDLQKSTADGTTTVTATLHLTKRAAKLFNRRFGTSFAPGAAAGTATTTLTTSP